MNETRAHALVDERSRVKNGSPRGYLHAGRPGCQVRIRWWNLLNRSVSRGGLLAALFVLPASIALAQFSDYTESPWQGGVLNFFGSRLITSPGTMDNFAGLVYNTSTMPADTGPLYAWDLAPGVTWSGNYYDGVGVLLNASSGTNIIDNNFSGTMQGFVSGSGEAFAFGINASGNVMTIHNAGLIDGEVLNNDGTAVGVYASGIITLTNDAGGTVSATAPYYAAGIYTVGGAQYIVNNGTITATATGGTQGDSANQAYAADIDMFSYDPSDTSPMYIVNNGSITVSCTGGATNIAHCGAIWDDQNDVTWVNNGTMTATMTGSSGDASRIYFGANNANVTFINTGTIFNGGGPGGQGMWMENDGTTGNMYFYNSGTIASGAPFAASIASYPDGPAPYGTAYATNTGTIMGGWLGFGWCGDLNFYDSGDIYTALAWLGGTATVGTNVYYGNVNVYITGLPTIQPTLSAGSGSNTLVFNLTGTLQQVNGNAASGTNLSAFKLVPSGSMVVSGKTYRWANFTNVSGAFTASVVQSAGPAGLTATETSSSQANLTWSAVTNAAGFNVKRSTMSGGPYTTIARVVAATNYVDNTAYASVRYYYVVSAMVSGLESSNSPQASVNLPLGNPWESQDVGAVGVAGSAAYGNGVFTVTGSGGDIWNSADAFRFVYVTNSGDFTMVARVVFVQGVNSWSKAGIMIRDSLEPGAANALIAVTPGNGVTFQYRASDGGDCNNNTLSGSPPYWVKLVRTGNTFTGYCSREGSNWTQQGTANIIMGSAVYAGLALTSHDSSSLCTAMFDNLIAPGWSSPMPPQPPRNLAAVLRSSNQVSLAWNSVTNAGGYNVKRSTTNDGPYSVIASEVTGTNFQDNNLAGGTRYGYVVSAVNTNGESLNSAQAVAITPSQTYGALIHRFSFSQTNGTTVADSIGGPVWSGTLPNGGNFGNGQLTFSSASQQYLNLPGGIITNCAATTIDMWIPSISGATGSPPYVYLIAFGNTDSGGNGCDYLFFNPNIARAVISGVDPGYGGEQGGDMSPLGDASNLHLTCVFNCPAGNIRIYTNGVLAATFTGITDSLTAVGSEFAYVGRSLYAHDSYLDWSLQELRIYNTALLASQIAASQALGPGQLLNPNNPVMTAALVRTNLTLSWPLANAGFTLQSCTNLILGHWLNVPAPAPQIINGQWVVSLPPPGGGGSIFYRATK